MLPVFVYNIHEENTDSIIDMLSRCAKNTNASFNVQTITNSANVAAGWFEGKDNQGAALLIIGVDALSKNGDLIGLKLGRKALKVNRDNYVVYVLEDKRDIEDVISVSSRVAGVLCLPIREKRASNVFSSILLDYRGLSEQSRKQLDGEQIVLKAGASIHRVHRGQILYVQALDKKLEVVMLSQTLQFYANMAKLIQRLGSDFIRCHRSYLVNKARIIQVDWPEMSLTVTGGLKVPISRSCKAQLKEALDENEVQ